jgi:putative flippase GtrA
MGSFLVMLHFDFLSVLVSNIFGKIVAGSFAFLAHRDFTFRAANEHRDQKQVLRYFLLIGINIPISSVVLGVLLTFISLPALAKFVSDAICVMLSYWISKKWIFSPPVYEASSSDFDRQKP